MKTNHINVIAFTMALLAAWVFPAAQAQASVTPAEARAIAKEAYIYGFPMVDHYRIQYSYFQDKNDPNYKLPCNQLLKVGDPLLQVSGGLRYWMESPDNGPDGLGLRLQLTFLFPK